MFSHCEVVILMLALTLDGRVHTGKILKGHEVVPHSRPYMALLEENTEGGTKYCDGFLLNEDFVMTAAHCKASSYKVFLGVHNFTDSNEERVAVSVEQAFPHKDFNVTTLKNDIMLLKLSSKVNFNKNVRPIALADESDAAPKSCIVSGWGSTDHNTGYMSAVLMEVNVTIVPNEKCPHKNFYCSVGEAGPGKGDSGGPLVCEDGKAYGVVSYKQLSGGELITGYAKIPDHRSWIGLTIKKHMTEM